MNRWSIAAAVALLALVQIARADKAPPPPKENAYPLVIEADPKVQEAKLVIPRAMLGKMKAGLDEDRGSNLASTNTVIAGAALTLALAFGGLWIVRRGPGAARNTALLVGAVAFFGITGALSADLAVPKLPAKTDTVIIEVVDKGDEVKLVVNKDKLVKVVEKK